MYWSYTSRPNRQKNTIVSRLANYFQSNRKIHIAESWRAFPCVFHVSSLLFCLELFTCTHTSPFSVFFFFKNVHTHIFMPMIRSYVHVFMIIIIFAAWSHIAHIQQARIYTPYTVFYFSIFFSLLSFLFSVCMPMWCIYLSNLFESITHS